MNVPDLANMTYERDATQDGLVTIIRLLSSRRKIDQIANTSSVEAVQDAMDDTIVNLEDIGNDLNDETRQEMMFRLDGSRLGATLAFTISWRSPATPRPTKPKRPRWLNWYRENTK